MLRKVWTRTSIEIAIVHVPRESEAYRGEHQGSTPESVVRGLSTRFVLTSYGTAIAQDFTFLIGIHSIPGVMGITENRP